MASEVESHSVGQDSRWTPAKHGSGLLGSPLGGSLGRLPRGVSGELLGNLLAQSGRLRLPSKTWRREFAFSIVKVVLSWLAASGV